MKTPTVFVAVSILVLPGAAFAQSISLDKAEEGVTRGTATSGEVLERVEGQVPEQAQPAIQRAREMSRTGQEKALGGLERGRVHGGGNPVYGSTPSRGGAVYGSPSGGAPVYGNPPGRPSFGGGAPARGGRGRP
jgi:hypothetical protein